MANTTRVVMPQLGESVHEGTISKWLVKPGDKVVEFEPMLEVDTDKVSAEVPAPVTGVLKEILAKEGQTVQAGAEIAVVEVGGDGKVTATPEAPAPSPKASSRGSAAGTPADAAPISVEKHATVEATELEGGEHRYSPAVQMLASELKVDLSVRRQNDSKRHPASSVAKKCCEAIIDRRRELDLSPRIQKLATRARPFVPGLIDRRIYERVSTLRSAFTSEIEEHLKVRQGAA